jgi:hypothetical protein
LNGLKPTSIYLMGEDSNAPDVYTDAGVVEIRDHLNDALEEVTLLTAAQKYTWCIHLKELQAETYRNSEVAGICCA